MRFSDLVEYYLDMETTGRNLETDEIITIQWQRLDRYTGKPIEELNILKRWEFREKEDSEKEILKTFLPNLKCKPFDFVFIGNNLLFDFCFLSHRIKEHNLEKFDISSLYDRAILDFKPILVMINNSFKGYSKVIPKTNPIKNEDIPILYKQGGFSEIIQYVKDEAEDFIKVYQILKKEMPSLAKLLKKGRE